MADLYLIDGNSYIYRAFHAIKGLSTSRGFPTNAVYGFTNMLLKLIRKRAPHALAIAFDSPAPTKRHRVYEEYKAQRPETPNSLLLQIPYIRKIVNALRIKTYEIQGYEADDILATIASAAAEEGIDVYIVTADKDMLQIVNDKVKIYDPVQDRVIDRKYIMKKFGVPPERIPEFMALTGDTIDNIPGVKGVGEKTAKELLSRFSLSELLRNPSVAGRQKLQKAIQESRDSILMSLELATLDKEVPLSFSLKECVLHEPDWNELLRLFRELEFGSLLKLIPTAKIKKDFKSIYRPEKLKEVLSTVKERLTLRCYAKDTDLLCLTISDERENIFYMPVIKENLLTEEGISFDTLVKEMSPFLKDRHKRLVGHNLKQCIKPFLKRGLGISALLEDVMIGSWLLNPNRPEHELEDLAIEYLSLKIPSIKEKLGKKKLLELPLEELRDALVAETVVISNLRDIIFRNLRSEGLQEVYYKIEMPLIEVLASMELKGIKADRDALRRLSQEVNEQMKETEEKIYRLAGTRFNINSPRQLSEVLFDRLGLKPLKKTKTGYSTDMSVLQELARVHELPKELLLWRGLAKLKSTYLDALQRMINPETGRIHTTFNQTATSTGRLSSSEPNLQNIPIKGEWGERIRRVFIADRGHVLLSADYSQIELRILAHLSNDEKMRRAFIEERDIHSETAMELFSLQENELTQDIRRLAKTVNFGIVYGISPFGLSEATGTSIEDARQFIERYFETYPGVKAYADRIIEEAKRLGYVRTLFGRKRHIPELHSPVASERSLGERLAINTPVQGTAADIIKMAMINIYRRIRSEGLRSGLVLQIHDELLFEVHEEELSYVKEMVKEEMESVVKLSVPLKVEIGTGKNWAEAHS
jgi:DNA polymerase-1